LCARPPEAEAEKNFDLYKDRALTQPVAITSEGEPRLLLISIEEYERLKRRDRQALRVEELSDEEVALIRAAAPVGVVDAARAWIERHP
jgi:PHD/YefM family antitoxin component YafN of YafNO toxin-antitoxin module